MKKKENKKAKNKEQGAESREQRAKGRGQSAKSKEQRVGSRKTEVGSAKRDRLGDADSDPRSRNSGSESAAPVKRNSTVFHKRLTPVIIDFSSEKLAIRACDLLRIFNN